MTQHEKDTLFLLLLLLSAVKARSPLTLIAIRALAAKVGFPDPDTAAAVAMAESGGNSLAVGDVLLGTSIGLWQIHLPSHPEYRAVELMNPEANARAAFAISSRGTNWAPWTTFRTGAYRKYMPAARVP